MSIRLYTSWFSPFARKVALALELKGLQYEAIDGLRRDFHDTLVTLNPRAEVPVLSNGDVTVINSHDIVQYLEFYRARITNSANYFGAAIASNV